METISLQVALPKELLSLLRLSQREMEQEVQHWVALELFRSRKISAGKAAQVAGISLSDFMDLARQYNVAWVDYTDEELETELTSSRGRGGINSDGFGRNADRIIRNIPTRG